MEKINPLQAHQERQTQLSELTEQMLHSYEALKSAYQEQGEKLKELKTSVIHYKQQSSYWEWQFKQIKSRQEELEAELEELKAKLRKREQQIFGNKSEKTTSHSEQQSEEKKHQRSEDNSRRMTVQLAGIIVIFLKWKKSLNSMIKKITVLVVG